MEFTQEEMEVIKKETPKMYAMVLRGLSMGDDNEVKSGSMEHLTRYVIAQSQDAPACTEAFVLTYRQFGATPREIMKYVETLFNHKKTDQFRFVLNLRVAQFFKLWVNVAYIGDFKQAGLLPVLLEFLDSKLHPTYSCGSNQVKLALLRAASNYRKEKSSKTEKEERTEKQRNLLDISATTLAEQLTYKESLMYRSIQPPELLNLSWSSKNKNNREIARNVVLIVERSNKVSYWVATEICMCRDLRKRVAAMKRFINVAYKCYEMHNYNTTMEVIGGLNNISVQRLKKTWAELPERYQQMWDRLTVIMDTKNNYGEYRNRLSSAKQQNIPAIPFLGVFLRDLTFIEDGNNDKIGKHANFEKINLLGEVIREVQAYQRVPYQFKKQSSITKYLRKALVLPEDPEDTIYELSLQVEAKAVPVLEDTVVL